MNEYYTKQALRIGSGEFKHKWLPSIGNLWGSDFLVYYDEDIVWC